MKNFAIYTLGCKVNQYESQQIRQLLEEAGLIQVDLEAGPDLVVVNTCCVTHIASSKSRQIIRKARKNNPDAKIVAAGCLPAGHTGELHDIPDDIQIIDRKDTLPEQLNSIIACNTVTDTPIKPENSHKIKGKKTYRTLNGGLNVYKGQSRAFVKVQDGCDGFCTYCIVPKIRNVLSYKSQQDIIDEFARLVYAGHREIVLTGIFLGAWGRDTVRRRKWDSKKSLLAGLIDNIARVEGLQRLRLSSLEPADVTDDLLEVLTKHPNIMPHMHLPLQSGSQPILKKMCRQYTIDDFMNTVDRVKRAFDCPAITTDIIAGFPGETDQDFQNTYDTVKQVEFSKIHVFSYSQRKNTPAAAMQGQLAPEIIKERSKVLHKLDEKLQKTFRQKFAGKEISIIVEETNPVKGRTERYFMTEFTNAENSKKGDCIKGILAENAESAEIHVHK